MVLTSRVPNVAPCVITLSVSERKAVSPVATCRFSMSKTPFLFLQCKGTKFFSARLAFLSFISDLFEMLNCKERRMTTFTVLRSYTVTQFHLPSAKFHFLTDIYIILLYIIYYIYNIKYFFLPKVTVQLHLMQLRNCVTV